MASYNRVILVGNLTRDPELRYIPSGTAVTEIGLAVGMEFAVKRLEKEVKHPTDGRVLKRIYEEVGVVKATEVEEGVTTVEAVTGTGFETGDLVVLKKE